MITSLGHLPGFFPIGFAALGLFSLALRIAIWSAREVLDLLRDLREFRRGR
jgi:hypothetical protein